MGKQSKAKPESKKTILPRKEATPSVESQFQVSWLIQSEGEDGKKLPGQWVPETVTRKSFGRKALIKDLRDRKNVGQFKVRKIK